MTVKKVLFVLAGIVALMIVVCIAATVYFVTLIKSSTVTAGTIFDIEEGQSSQEIVRNLQSKGLIKKDWPMLILMKYRPGTIKAGAYEIPNGATLTGIYQIIISGEIKEIKVTIPEGYRVEQIGQVLRDHTLVNYSDFVAMAKPYEGKLFPDTYYFGVNDGPEKIINKMLDDYNTRTAKIKPTANELILASIVEREAALDNERALIAGIYAHRLTIGMKLQADPTVQYGKDNNAIKKITNDQAALFAFWGAIGTKDYLTVDSVFNTYIISALPPAPICNPGLKSIEAAKNYQKTDYLYFLQHDGQIYPAKTEAEHNRNRVKILGAKL